MTLKSGRAKTGGRSAAKVGGRARLRGNVLKSELLDSAVSILAERGFAGTNLQHIADAVGISRPAIYHYFESKEALLAELVAEVTLPSAKIFDEMAKRNDLTPIERIREVVKQLVLAVVVHPLHFKMMDRCEGELPPKTFEFHHTAKRRVLVGMTALIKDAIDAGQVRVVDPKIASFSIIGMCNWCAWWFRSDGAYSSEEIASQIADMAVHALRRSLARDAALGIRNLTDEVRESLRFIDRMSSRE